MSFSNSYYYNDNDDNHNPNSATPQEAEEESPFSHFSFPSPFLDEKSLFLSDTAVDQSTQQPNFGRISDKPLLEISKDISRNTPPTQQKKDSTTKKIYSSRRRKSGKKDRHSKIHTAQGFRDRRMRLSLEIARKFFDLQDMLGFDKASNTIDWLFSQSESAIRKLSCSNPQLINNDNMSDSEETRRKIVTEGDSCDSVRKISEESITKGYKDITKELRAKARARARERTREKMLMRSLEKSKDNNCKFAHQLGPEGNPNSLFEAGQESTSNSTTQDHEHISTNVENLMSSATESPSGLSASCYGYDELFSSGGLDFYSNYKLSFLGNWDILLKHGPDLDSRTSNSNFLGKSSCYQYMQ